ncbi:hypothetical protein [Gephyromycinifex aptenodytis]|uniref:hypothetical protein n=1 Tax=Gephyromycinifex aptenodytis TaxID=2716227 RepID=UPI0014486003|nr:hypothetical protein [Gephyromycinifex aptenodytis]
MTHLSDADRTANAQAQRESSRPEAAHDEDESVVEVHLNQEFLDSLGPDKSQRFVALIEQLGAGKVYSAATMREAFGAGLAEIGVEMSPVEQERYVERLCAGNIVDVDPPENHRGR